MPYNYLLSTESQMALPKTFKWENAILIFDEAHNLESSCMDAASVEITTMLIQHCVTETTMCREEMLAREENFGHDGTDAKRTANEYSMLTSFFHALEAKMGETAVAGVEPRAQPGSYIFELMGHWTSETGHDEVEAVLSDAISLLTEKAAEEGQRQGSKTRHYHLHTFQRHLRVIMNSREDADDNYRVLVHLEQPWGASKAREPKPTLSYWCFKPGVAMQRLKRERGCRSIILTSGTLCPLRSLECELGLPFERTLENVHVIQCAPSLTSLPCLEFG